MVRGQPVASAWGTGPGAITADGCAVELYRMLPPGEEPAVVAAAAAPGAAVLDLGSGAGRIANALAARGHRVVAVDASAEMLRHVRGALPVCSTIEGLWLRRRFDVVLLASQLVNTPDLDQRDAFLRTCRRHVGVRGQVIVQRHPPAWFEAASPAERVRDGLTIRLRDIHRPSPSLLSATVDYELGGRRWSHHFSARQVDDAELAVAFRRAGLRMSRSLSDDGAWVAAAPV